MFSSLHSLSNICYYQISWFSSVTVGIKWYLIAILTCISMITSDTDYLFMSSHSPVPLSMERLFMSFPHLSFCWVLHLFSYSFIALEIFWIGTLCHIYGRKRFLTVRSFSFHVLHCIFREVLTCIWIYDTIIDFCMVILYITTRFSWIFYVDFLASVNVDSFVVFHPNSHTSCFFFLCWCKEF